MVCGTKNMLRCLFYLLLTAVSLHLVTADDKTYCEVPEAEVGTCINLPDCDIIYSTIAAVPLPISKTVEDFIKLSFCGFNGHIPKVCCPPKQDIMISYIGLSNHSNAYLLKRNDCGVSNSLHSLQSRTAMVNDFPWMALLVYDSPTRPYQCEGSIITERYILTAAHCVTFELKKVRLGEHTISTERDCELFVGERYCAPPIQEFGIEKMIKHQLYSEPNKYADVALIRLAGSIDFTQGNVRPICLPLYTNLRDLNLTSASFTVISWGFTEQNSRSDVLLTIPVKEIGNERCKKRNKRQSINNNQICAGTRSYESRSGGSGAPLMRLANYDNKLRYVQYGIFSYGSRDRQYGTVSYVDLPGVYTRVSKYVKWILDSLEA